MTSPKASPPRTGKELTVIPATKQLNQIRNSAKLVMSRVRVTIMVEQLNLSNQTSIKRLWSPLWITNRWLVSKVQQMTSSHKTISTIVSRTTDNKNTLILAGFVNLLIFREKNRSSWLFAKQEFLSLIILFNLLRPSWLS